MMGRMMSEYFLPLLASFQFTEFLKHRPDVPDSDVTPEYCAAAQLAGGLAGHGGRPAARDLRGGRRLRHAAALLLRLLGEPQGVAPLIELLAKEVMPRFKGLVAEVTRRTSGGSPAAPSTASLSEPGAPASPEPARRPREQGDDPLRDDLALDPDRRTGRDRRGSRGEALRTRSATELTALAREAGAAQRLDGLVGRERLTSFATCLAHARRLRDTRTPQAARGASAKSSQLRLETATDRPSAALTVEAARYTGQASAGALAANAQRASAPASVSPVRRQRALVHRGVDDLPWPSRSRRSSAGDDAEHVEERRRVVAGGHAVAHGRSIRQPFRYVTPPKASAQPD